MSLRAQALRVAKFVGLAVALGCAPGCGSDPVAAVPDAGPGDAGTPVDAGFDAGVTPRDAGPSVRPLAFTRCPGQPDGGTNECATLTVPVDYDDRSRGTIDLPVLRRPASIPSERIGAIAWNPGGPGATTYPRRAAILVGDGALGQQIGERFDLIAMDWRGVGSSDPAIECDVERAAIGLMASRYDLPDPMDLERVAALGAEVVETCVAAYDRDFLASVGSRNAARDLDRLRAALGDEQLSFWGFSYGTTLGATYATMFPDRVRAFVLDSVSLSGSALITPAEIRSWEARLDEFFTWCAATPGARPGCEFARGRSAAELDGAWRALVAELDRYPTVLDGRTVSGNTVRSAAIALRLEGRVGFPSMGVAFARAERGEYAPLLSMPTMPETQPDTSSPFAAIRVADDGRAGLSPREATDWLRVNFWPYNDRLALVFLYGQLIRLLWPIEPADGPPLVGPTSARPLLIIGSTGDLATPYADAVSLVATLENGSHLLTYEGTEHAVSNSVPCLRDEVYRFFLDPSRPPTVTRCVGVEP